MKIIELRGAHYEMGRQHAQQVQDLRPRVVKAIRQRLRSLEEHEVDLQPHAIEMVSAWAEIARPTLDMLRGIADGLELKWDPFFRFTIASYLEDRIQSPNNGDGCTVWAASGSTTCQGVPVLAKNRDYRPEHKSLQCLVHAQPVKGYRYLYATSAGNPAVFSSGMNEVGLAVADTRVASRVVGPGLARYSVMMEILEHHSQVSSALEYVCQVPHIGDGTLTLIDRGGEMAVFEAGHTTQSILYPEHDFVVTTNHFRSPQLRDCWVDPNLPESQGHSQNRHVTLVTALEAAQGSVDTVWACTSMADHGGRRTTLAYRRQHAICRHRNVDPQSTTISTALYLPQDYALLFADGQPCRTPFQAWRVI